MSISVEYHKVWRYIGRRVVQKQKIDTEKNKKSIYTEKKIKNNFLIFFFSYETGKVTVSTVSILLNLL